MVQVIVKCYAYARIDCGFHKLGSVLGLSLPVMIHDTQRLALEIMSR